MQESFDSVYRKVEQVLKDIPDTRNSDRLLSWKVWEVYYGVDGSMTLHQYMTVPTEGTIARIRAEIQNVFRRYLPTKWEVAKMRQWNEEEWKGLLGYPPAENHQLGLGL